jgi:[ribosomal protein S5]-alanine N-acetyltransferase
MVHLLAISSDGSVVGHEGVLASELSEVLQHTVSLYSRVGFEPPWISYLAVAESQPVGICSFKSPPVNGRVEIAYFTFPEYEGRGIGTEMASQLVAIANAQPMSCIAAQTLLERNASHRVLEKLGFRAIGPVEHPEDGVVLEWQLIRRVSAWHAADADYSKHASSAPTRRR